MAKKKYLVKAKNDHIFNFVGENQSNKKGDAWIVEADGPRIGATAFEKATGKKIGSNFGMWPCLDPRYFEITEL